MSDSCRIPMRSVAVGQILSTVLSFIDVAFGPSQAGPPDLAGISVTFHRQSHKSSDLVFQNYYAKKTIENTNTKYVVTIR